MSIGRGTIKRCEGRRSVFWRVKVGEYIYNARSMREAVIARRRLYDAALSQYQIGVALGTMAEVNVGASISAKQLLVFGITIEATPNGSASGFFLRFGGMAWGPFTTPSLALAHLLTMWYEDLRQMGEYYEESRRDLTERVVYMLRCDGCGEAIMVDITDGDDPPQNAICEECQEKLYGDTIGQ